MRLGCLPLVAGALGACEPIIEPTNPTDPPDHTDEHLGAFDDLSVEAWSFFEVDDMKCGDGNPTGVAVNPGDDPTKTVVIVQGGGACWNAATCFGLDAASHIETGWGETQMRSEVQAVDNTPFFDRGSANNPWADATFVLVPYCTGDLHAGRSEAQYDPLEPTRIVHHAGDQNIQQVAALLGGALPDTEQAWILGFSAGGYGVQLQADRFAGIWPQADTALLADGSPMVQPRNGRWATWQNAWQLRLPEDCPGCDTSMPAVLQAQLAQLPGQRLALASSRSDAVISLYFNYGAGSLSPAVDALADDVFAGNDQAQAFLVDGDAHVLLGDPSAASTDGTNILDWFVAWRDDREDWVDRW